MGRHKKPEENSNQISSLPTDIELDFWRRHGLEDVYFQKESTVNFWTVMGGIAAGALLTQLSPLINEVQSGNWHLIIFFVSSILTIVSSWVQSAWGSMVLKWKLTIPGTLIFFLNMFSLSIQCLMVTKPGYWMVSSASVVMFSIMMQYYFKFSGSWDIFSETSRRRFESSINAYYLFLLISVIGAISILKFPGFFLELSFAIISLLSVIVSLIIQHKGMQIEKSELRIP
jgi:hypothetical protein